MITALRGLWHPVFRRLASAWQPTRSCRFVLGALGCVSIAHADWVVTDLHPSGLNYSIASSIASGIQGGEVSNGTATHAALWRGTAVSFQDLHPSGATSSAVRGVDANWQVGFSAVLGHSHASMWSGTAASWVDLHPVTGYRGSIAASVHGGQIVGWARHNSIAVDHACLWSGTAASFTRLFFDGNSSAHDVQGGHQVGRVPLAAIYRQAALWSGSASSIVYLHPTGATESSADAVYGARQGGFASFNGIAHASLWSGSANTWVDLSPEGSTDSFVRDMGPTTQVGYATYAGFRRAGLWRGTSDSWTDLHVTLGTGFVESVARSVYEDSSGLYVSGWASDSSGNGHAILWHNPVLSASSYALVHGIPRGGGLASLRASDDDRLRIRMNFETTRLAPKVILDATFNTTLLDISRLDVALEGSATGAPITHTVSLWNGAGWIQVDSFIATQVDSIRTISLTTGVGAFLESGQIRVRLQSYTFDRENLSAAESRIDCIRLTAFP